MDFSKLKNYLFLGLLIAVTGLFFSILKPFVYPLFWAAVIATLFYPLFKKINDSFKRPNLSAAASLAIITVSILLPISIIGTLLIKESVGIYSAINDNRGEISESLQKFFSALQHNQFTAGLQIDQELISEKISEVSRNVVTFIFNIVTNFTQNSLTFIGLFIMMLYALFFFLRDGERMLKKVMYLCPLGDRYEQLLYKKFTSTALATLKGVLIIGSIQGLLGGIALAVAGVQGALIWGILMAFFSITPGIGCAIIWVPASIILFLTGDITGGLIVAGVGLLLISTIDNLLRPVLVGKNIQMHPLYILFSTLGGIALFGISGFVIGPVITALFLSFWEIYEQYYHSELTQN